MIRSILNGQRGGVATLVSIGFLAFSIPLISGSLGLAEANSIDARVKTEKLSQEYCSLAVVELFNYLVEDVSVGVQR